MGERASRSNYVARPRIPVRAARHAARGYQQIGELLRSAIERSKDARGSRSCVLALECYPGVDLEELREQLVDPLEPSLALCAGDCTQDAARIQARIADCITDDRVFGVMSHYRVEQFLDTEKVARARSQIGQALLDPCGPVVVYGMGCTQLCSPDLLVYVDLTRWEIQRRFRHEGLSNWKANNAEEDPLRKFKYGYFFEWRMADRQKRAVMPLADFRMEANRRADPVMVDAQSYREALEEVSRRPFRMVPYFDESVWGGHWMQQRFGLDPSARNFGWAFDGVPEENSLLLDFLGIQMEVPAIDLVFFQTEALLGPRVQARFGAEFPIRFDFLDTMGGGNLSLQVHPTTDYIRDAFGMSYTQDESYYIMDAGEDSCVYLGCKDGCSKEELVGALKRSNEDGSTFDAGRFVNRIPVSRHDHVHIPAGTMHCGGADTVILEISATPYIFTFKLWDWGRLGLDGRPRPVHIGHGAPNIDMRRNTSLVESGLVDRRQGPHQNLSAQAGVREERTGLDELEFIETHRFWIDGSADIQCHQSVNMLNLIEGEAAVVESLDASFPPLEVHYGETFVVPADVGEYRVRKAPGITGRIAVIQAYVRI